MKLNPPHLTDWSTVARLRRIGIEPGKSFDASKVTPDVLARAAAAGLKLMHDKAPTLARIANGWQMNTDTMGVYGNYYLKRAIVALLGLGANQVEDAIYPLNVSDADGKPVTGGQQIRPPFHEGRTASSGRVLVADALRRGGIPGRQCAQQIRDRRPRCAQVRRRRLARPLCPEREPRP